MKTPLQFTILLGLAAVSISMAAAADPPQSKSDAAAVREAVRFEKAKAAADRKQLRVETAHPSEANSSSADRMTADRLAEKPEAKDNVKPSKSDAAAMAEAIRFERFKDAAAARQMRLEAKRNGEASRASEKPKN